MHAQQDGYPAQQASALAVALCQAVAELREPQQAGLELQQLGLERLQQESLLQVVETLRLTLLQKAG